MTPSVHELLACIREYRRLSNQTVKDVREVDALHKEADRLLKSDPERDDPLDRYDAPWLVEYRNRIAALFSPQRY